MGSFTRRRRRQPPRYIKFEQLDLFYVPVLPRWFVQGAWYQQMSKMRQLGITNMVIDAAPVKTTPPKCK